MAGISDEEFAEAARRRLGEAEFNALGRARLAQRYAVTDDHDRRISAVENRLGSVETTLSNMSTEAARSGQAILSKVEVVAAEVSAIKSAQATEAGRKVGAMEVEAKFAAAEAERKKQAESRSKWIMPVVTSLIVAAVIAVVAGLGGLIAVGISQFIRNASQPQEINATIEDGRE